MAASKEVSFSVYITSSGSVRVDGGGMNKQQERQGLTRMIVLVVTILGTFYQGMQPSPLETHYKVVVGTLVVVLIYTVAWIVLSRLRPDSIFYTIVGEIELFSQLLFVPLFLLMLVPFLGLISIALWAISLLIWIATKHVSHWLIWPRVLWGQAAVAVRTLFMSNPEGQRPPV